MNFNQLKNYFKIFDYCQNEFKKNIDEYMAEGGPYDVDHYVGKNLEDLKSLLESTILKRIDSDGKEKVFRSLFFDGQRRIVLSFEDYPVSSATERVSVFGKDITAMMLADFQDKLKDQHPQEVVFMNSDGEKKKF